MIISDLNYLENTSEEVIGGTFTFFENLFVKKTVTSTFKATGNLGTSEGSANATGPNTLTQSILAASANEGNSSSGGFVLAGSNK
ncbi:MAG: hypothetical protein V7L21_21015 [Nostoc sp.]|uniref:hypothetical protein n=1 Tax=Nostoc sp. TaxID=1180 RepID=UPI002FFA645D